MKKRGYLLLLIFIIGCAQEQAVQQPEIPVSQEEVPQSAEPKAESIQEQEIPTAEETDVKKPPEEPSEDSYDAVTAETPVHPNLIAHWKFEDNAKDSINNYNGKIIGDAEFDTGKKGKALAFNGQNYVDLSEHVNEIGSLKEGTIAFYFKFESLLDKQTVMPIFYIGVDKEKKTEDNLYIIEIGHFNEQPWSASPEPDPDNKKIYSTWMDENHRDPVLCFDSNINLEENKWHHFAVVVGPDGNTGYLDGVEINNRQYNFGNAKAKRFLDSVLIKEKLHLGYGRSSYMLSPDFIFFKGYLDDVRIYNKPLSESEIKELI